MATTYLQVVNKVLVRLRESTVATVTENSYSTLIGAIVNRVKTEIEDAWQWHALRDTYLIPTTANVASYTFTSSGPDMVILDAWNNTEQSQMRRGTFAGFNENYFGTMSPATGAPTEYIDAGLNVDYDLQVDVWPRPTSVYQLYFNVYKPQAELSSGSDVPIIPIVPLVEGAVARAMAERGDDGGVVLQAQESLYRDLLSSAIARDLGRDSTEADWVVV